MSVLPFAGSAIHAFEIETVSPLGGNVVVVDVVVVGAGGGTIVVVVVGSATVVVVVGSATVVVVVEVVLVDVAVVGTIDVDVEVSGTVPNVPPIDVVASATSSGHVATPDVAGPGPLKFVVSACTVARTSTAAAPLPSAITSKVTAGDRKVPDGIGPSALTSTTFPDAVTSAGTGVELIVANVVTC